MSQDQLKRILEEGRVILRPSEHLLYYISVYTIGLFAFMILTLGWNQSQRVVNPHPSTLTNKELLIIFFIGLFLACLIFFALRSRLKLVKFKTRLGSKETKDQIFVTASRLNFSVKINSHVFFEFQRITAFAGSHKLTIIIDDGSIYLNCRRSDGAIGGFYALNKTINEFKNALT